MFFSKPFSSTARRTKCPRIFHSYSYATVDLYGSSLTPRLTQISRECCYGWYTRLSGWHSASVTAATCIIIACR